MSPEDQVIRRILVALDASPSSFTALEAAARLASQLEAELEGLFVEDEVLLRCVELPVARVVGSFSGVVQQVARRDLEQQLRTRAARARQALEMIANRANLRWTFRVARGAVTAELLSAATTADLISLGWCGWSQKSRSRIGATADMVLREAAAPVLLIDREPHRGRGVVVVYDDSDSAKKGLALGHRLGGSGATPLVVALLNDGEHLKEKAEQSLHDIAPATTARYLELGREPLKVLDGLGDREGIGVLILPKPSIDRVPGLLSRLRWPVLVVG